MKKLLDGMVFGAEICKAELQEAAKVVGIVLDEQELEEMTAKIEANW